MKRILAILTIVLCALCTLSETQAAIYNKRTQTTAEAPAPADEPADKGAETAPADDMEHFSGRFYQNCIKKQNDRLSPQDMKLLCSCTAMEMKQTMTLEDIQVMTTPTPEGAAMQRFMMLNVYAPCMEIPTRALIHSTCMADPGVKNAVSDPAPICDCVSRDMGAYIGENAKTVMEQSLEQNPGAADPMAAFLSSSAYQQAAGAKLLSCLQKHMGQ